MYMDDILKLFVTDDQFRPILAVPHKKNNNIVATNGYRMIVIPDKYLKKEYDNIDEFPKWERIIDQVNEIKLDSPIKINTKNLNDAFNQLRTIDIYPTCELCDGTGVHTCEICNTNHTCGECAGTGEQDEYESIGIKYDDEDSICISNNRFNPNNLKPILTLLQQLETTSINLWTDENMKPSYFESKDIKIIIMPINNGYSKNTVHVKLT